MSRRDVAQVVGPEFAGIGAKNIYRITDWGRHENLILSNNFQVPATFSVVRLAVKDQTDDGGPKGLDQMMGLSGPTESDTLIAIGDKLQPRQ